MKLERRQLIAFVGSAILIVGAVLPIGEGTSYWNEFSPTKYSVTMFDTTEKALVAIALMVVASLSVLCSVYRRYRWLLATTAVALVAVVGVGYYTYIQDELRPTAGAGVILVGIVLLGWAALARN